MKFHLYLLLPALFLSPTNESASAAPAKPNVLFIAVDDLNDWKMAHWAAKQLERRHDKPVFLACGIFRPHEPWNVPPKYYEKFPLDKRT